VIERADGEPAGYLGHASFAYGNVLSAGCCELAEGVSYLAVAPSIIRYLWATGKEFALRSGKTYDSFGFGLGAQHPIYQACTGRLLFEAQPYAFYVRVPDLPGFLRHIGPALEQRLPGSAIEGHTGELKISFFRDGIRLVFAQGRLVSVEPWMPRIHDDEGDAAFPNLTFLQLVFGYRTLDQIKAAYADCSASYPAQVVLNALFPRQHSHVWGVA
jgi:hypothetical protein